MSSSCQWSCLLYLPPIRFSEMPRVELKGSVFARCPNNLKKIKPKYMPPTGMLHMLRGHNLHTIFGIADLKSIELVKPVNISI